MQIVIVTLDTSPYNSDPAIVESLQGAQIILYSTYVSSMHSN